MYVESKLLLSKNLLNQMFLPLHQNLQKLMNFPRLIQLFLRILINVIENSRKLLILYISFLNLLPRILLINAQFDQIGEDLTQTLNPGKGLGHYRGPHELFQTLVMI